MRKSGKIGICSSIGFVIVLIVGFVAFPLLIKSKIKSMVNLKPGGDVRNMYMKFPFYLNFKIYVFNLTNPNEVTNGAKPILQEIGPYYYEEWKEKILISDDEAEDTMTFRSKDTFIFRPDLSAPLTGDEIVTIPHPLIVGMVLMVLNDKPAMLSLVNKAINSIYQNPTTPFLSAPVNQIFFDGLIINCTVTDFAGKAVCSQLRTEAKDLEHVSEHIFKFSLLGPKNGTIGNKFKVRRGVKDHRDIGRVLEFNDEPEMKIWTTKECNQYKGTEGTIFPALIPNGADIPSFAPPLCRSLVTKFDGKVKYEGLKVSRYIVDFGDMSTNPEEKCYCPTPDTCWSKGIIDLTKCNGPALATLPHFYLSDPKLLEDVKGLSPDQEKHEIVILFETMTGSAVSAKNRLQFNMPMKPVEKISSMKNLPDVVMPMFWVEESIDVNKTYTGPIKSLFITILVVKISSWFLLLGTLFATGAAGYVYWTSGPQVQITPVKDVKPKKSLDISMVQSNTIDRNETEGAVNHVMSGREFDKY